MLFNSYIFIFAFAMILKQTLKKSFNHDFGIKLKLENIEERINNFMKNKENYYLNYSDEIEKIRKLHLETRETRRRNCL